MAAKSLTSNQSSSWLRGMGPAFVVGALLLTTRAAAAPPQGDYLDLWKPTGVQVLINGPLRVNLGFTDQSGTPRVAVVSSLSQDELAGMPVGLAQTQTSDLLQAGHFQALWSAMKASVCSDIQHGIGALVNHSPNTAYDIQPCAMNPHGYLTATFQESWQDDSYHNVNGRRIRFNYLVPLNGVTFWVTGPGTCHRGSTCPTEPEDPAFTVVFTADIAITCDSAPGANDLTILPLKCTPATSIDVEDVIGGNVTGQLVSAAEDWFKQMPAEGASVVATAGAAAPAALAGFVAGAVNVAVKGIGAAVASENDKHLRDAVSAWVSTFLSSNTLKANAVNISADFNGLFQSVYLATLGGLRPFVFGISPQLDLDLGLVYPLPAKPQLENTTAAANKGSIFSPTIAIAQPEVVAGEVLPVTATYFRGTYVNSLSIGWNRTVLGTPKSTLSWGPPKTTITTQALTFDATNLKPATQYGFQVRECDGLTCAPESEMLVASTEVAGANDVVFWLDGDRTHLLGANIVGTTGGSFQTNVLIPPGTTPGAHVLHAGVGTSPPASATIQVCQPGGCGATVAVVNVSNGTLYPAGAIVEVGNSVVLRGSRFIPGGSVAIFVDTVQGAKAGNAPVGPLGNFQANFTMPMVVAGQHRLVAVEAKPGGHPMLQPIRPMQPGPKPQPLDPNDFVTAAVPVFVQAMAQ